MDLQKYRADVARFEKEELNLIEQMKAVETAVTSVLDLNGNADKVCPGNGGRRTLK